MKKLGEKYGVELPITNAVYEICYGADDGLSCRERCQKVLEKMFSRDMKSEF